MPQRPTPTLCTSVCRGDDFAENAGPVYYNEMDAYAAAWRVVAEGADQWGAIPKLRTALEELTK